MLIDDLNWRYATKKMDPSKIVSDENVAKILEAANLAPTSSGVQPFHIFLVTDPQTKILLCQAAHGQTQVNDCSHLLVFAAWDNYTDARLDAVIATMKAARPEAAEALTSYYTGLKAMVLPRSADVNYDHAARQAYIAFGMAIAQAAELHVDATPMEGFDADKVNDILDLRKQGLRAVTLLPLGYRAEQGDWMVNLAKVRRPIDELVTRV